MRRGVKSKDSHHNERRDIFLGATKMKEIFPDVDEINFDRRMNEIHVHYEDPTDFKCLLIIFRAYGTEMRKEEREAEKGERCEVGEER